ncbi:hypothetical protein [Dehalogenimonas etheniformans]|uniref:Uncharacterized protein n=1 Tax=Dehalogenimonas etheniformans TaxID=1536648 RepID=A0A2P5P7C6_9CHLR|nr:hypothetical protein [Dehalogenimonas etheniformans]PPD58207.1 hypothetical protein JP09_005295 [Dehalogenimonas etheniformans]QNT75617.1 hypothetical protein HX448_02395 [Dehalogenimonas etheniformans]
MGLTLGEAIRHITNKNYAIVAADLFDEIFGRKYGDAAKIPARDKGSWPIKIEDKLKDTHFAKMVEGEFKRTRVDIASDTYLEVKRWLEDEVGVPHPCIDHDFKLGVK